MPLYQIDPDQLVKIGRTTFEAAHVKERDDLQRLLRAQISVLMPDAMVLAEEFGNWDESRRRIDLLVLDRDANLVVVELKRTEDGEHMDLQALRYAAMVSAMTFGQAVEAHAEYLRRLGIDADPRASILAFLEWDEPDEDAFGQDTRILLASSDFSKELTTAVLWLNTRGLDIRCVRMVPYEHDGRILLDVQQVIPLPEAEEYQVRVREKETQERAARQGLTEQAQRFKRFWGLLLEKANRELDLHRNITPSRTNWIAATTHGLYFSYVVARDDARVELYLGRSDRAENKAIFDELYGRREQIEASYGAPLDWQRLNNKGASRIAGHIKAGSFKDESSWGELQRAMVDAMGRLERSLAPFVAAYRTGAKPAMREPDAPPDG